MADSMYMPGDEDFSEGLRDEMEWPIVWQRAIAHAWTNDEFRQLLLKNARKAFKQFDYDVPSGLEIRVVAADGDDKGWSPELAARGVNGWVGSDLTTLTIFKLPPAPEPGTDQLLAITDYFALGRALPFTTCCC